jgi:excinuclease ABC subunit C
MQAAARVGAYEEAAVFRDRIAMLRQIQATQQIDNGHRSVDVIGLAMVAGKVCLHVMKIRQGRIIANENFSPSVPRETEQEEILAAFLSQFYVNNPLGVDIPKEIIVPCALLEMTFLASALSARAAHGVRLIHPTRGQLARWLLLATTNASHAVSQCVNDQELGERRLQALKTALNLTILPKRIECFDVSHTSGAETMASCVVCDEGVMNPAEYRRFSLKDIPAGDDYAGMKQALMRRYRPLSDNPAALPDMVLVDGGKGQVTQAKAVFEALAIHTVLVLGIAKGPTRKAGLETLVMNEASYFLPAHGEALHFLQHIRDEAHRFAITGHRKKRARASLHSRLEDIEGVGAIRRRALLHHFGGWQGVVRASIIELNKVPGIHLTLAKRIYDALHEE